MKKTADITLSMNADYRHFIEELKERITGARNSAARAVNRNLILLYWDIGRGIVEKQLTLGWGESVVEMVSADLRRAFPEMRGFSANNLWLIRKFYSEYSAAEFLEHLVQEMEMGPRHLLPQPVADLRLPIRPARQPPLPQFLNNLFKNCFPQFLGAITSRSSRKSKALQPASGISVPSPASVGHAMSS